MTPDFDRQNTLSRLFSPASPVKQQQFFAGRQKQMDRLLKTVGQVGEHAVIFGEPGVGKTSLARTMFENLRGTDLPVIATCDSSDSFARAWRKALEDLPLRHEVQGVGFSPQNSEELISAASFLPPRGKVSPNDVRKVLERLGQLGNIVIVMDEFDKLEDTEIKRLFAETMKMVSDFRIPATLILVGVADNVRELISGHTSVPRGLAQILMPRMSTLEMTKIIEYVEKVDMSITDGARDRITRLSQGLPHYTHLLARDAALSADERGADLIEVIDVEKATREAIENAPLSLKEEYQRATMSFQKTLYPQVLLACALIQGDELGYFSSADVRPPLSAIQGKPCDTRTFSRHLNELSNPGGERGAVLQKIESARTLQFRFVNPLLQPFVIIKGLAEGDLDEKLLEEFGG